MKNHLKRIAAPKTWHIDRKNRTFIVKPNTSGHPLEEGLPLGVFLRDVLRLATTMNEVKKLLQQQAVEVDLVRRKDHRFFVGLFDVVGIPSLSWSGVVAYDAKGRVAIHHFKDSSETKLGKVTGKRAIAKGKFQYAFHDGKHLLSDQPFNVGDSVLLHIPSGAISSILPRQRGAVVYLTKGKHQSDVGILKEVQGEKIVYTSQLKAQGQDIETAARYVFVVPGEGPLYQALLQCSTSVFGELPAVHVATRVPDKQPSSRGELV